MYLGLLLAVVPGFVKEDQMWWSTGANLLTEVLFMINDDGSIPAIDPQLGIILYPIEGNNIEIGYSSGMKSPALVETIFWIKCLCDW